MTTLSRAGLWSPELAEPRDLSDPIQNQAHAGSFAGAQVILCKKKLDKILPGGDFSSAPPSLHVIYMLEMKAMCLADMRRAGITASGPQTAA